MSNIALQPRSFPDAPPSLYDYNSEEESQLPDCHYHEHAPGDDDNFSFEGTQSSHPGGGIVSLYHISPPTDI